MVSESLPLFMDAEDYQGNPIVLNDVRVQVCTQCGCLVLNELQHVDFHLKLGIIVNERPQ